MSKRFHGEAFTTTTMMSAGGKTHEQEENIGPRLIRQPRRMKRLLGTVKRQIFGPSYDPYQRDQVEENDEKTATEKNKEEEEVARDERPTKRHRSIASALMNSISTVAYELFWNTGPRPTITDEKTTTILSTTSSSSLSSTTKRNCYVEEILILLIFQTSSAWEHRLQQAEQFIRRVCLQSQQQQQQQRQRFNNESSTSWFGLPPFAAEAYKKAVEEDNNKWGLVNKEDYEVCFLVNNSSIPPPKPKRNIQHQQQPSIVPNY